MTHAERNRRIIEALEERTKRALVSREASRKMLIDEGIYNSKGELLESFGGKGKKDRDAA